MNKYAMLPRHDKYRLRVAQRVHNRSLDGSNNGEYRRVLNDKMRMHMAALLTEQQSGKVTERRDDWTTLLELELYVFSPDEFFHAVNECAMEYLSQMRAFRGVEE